MTRSHAKALRANMTEAERRLWYFLRSHRFAGMKFKRQALIGRYIVDFVSFQRRLVVEVDGGQHADSEADLPRTRWLEDQGFRILRFWNNEVLSNKPGPRDNPFPLSSERCFFGEPQGTKGMTAISATLRQTWRQHHEVF